MSVKSLKTGTRSFSLLAGNTPEHHVLLAETTVGVGGTANITFSNIPADYQHLQIRGIARDTTAFGQTANLRYQYNSDTGSNYAWHRLYGDGATATSDQTNTTTQILGGVLVEGAATASRFGVNIIDILDYASTSKYKTSRALYGADLNGSGYVFLSSGLWMSTSAITSIKLYPTSGNFAQYTSFQLYGIK